ncbi:MAG: MarR family transcriptional regulator [Proteobacteria bacterium]|nr:MarR family transcriptional regulator [Pseudomonadota bacterium]MBU1452159.1 MarR family transcriptional regulator [Pseudomonadota bacterium]MBU2467554.1 MarR family transcriptional regulator [Pseudomonadota bacterium]MBU2518091.1 MarR family transcriptional regulator [Pseudomonadota bacterium]
MLCEQCNSPMEPEEEREFGGRKLCEDCYIDALSPAKTCDPWATYTASRLDTQELNPAQEVILKLIAQQGHATLAELMKATGLDEAALMREIAALRHMELIRGAMMPGGGRAFKLFKDQG